jgi:hypothetical protein
MLDRAWLNALGVRRWHEDPRAETEEQGAPSRAGDEWLSLFDHCEAGRWLAHALGWTYPIVAESDDHAPYEALVARGACVSPVVAERALDAVSPPRWRHPVDGEIAKTAIVLPVFGVEALTAGTLSLFAAPLADFAHMVVDLVAIPVDGGRPMSWNGLTAAVGDFTVSERGGVMIYGSGLRWLKAWLETVRMMGREMPAALTAKTIEAPEHAATLMLEANAFEWRMARPSCVLPAHAESVIVPDSQGLALAINAKIRAKEKAPRLPSVEGPAQPSQRRKA